ncbi:hypothetical protein [Nannocystis punicea]|uniref:Uncharacterized protein n=1 Tax=Nannocystis punicea TaxID=2995304 RepID=A0ABY7H9D1_9BACT|nr:hypothetical protein [Nannocystis poenicansa]WAS95644.1 hypothetical protein O0S08_05730 [Nannocystis poenicansa]
MRRGSAAWAIVASVAGCVPPPFQCGEDAACDLMPGGRCEAGRCSYEATSTTTGGTTAPTGGEVTGGAASCEAWERALAIRGKATGVALADDGGAYVVGFTSEVPLELRALRLDDAGEVGWSHAVDGTESPSVDDDTDLWARLFVHQADELVVVYSRRDPDDVTITVKTGPHVRRLAAEDGAVIGEADELALQTQSLRGVSMPDAKTMLLAGERQDDVWYQSAALLGGVWSPAWPAVPEPFAPDADFDSPAIAQAIALSSVGDEVAVGGTWNLPDGDAYTAWVRRVALADGAVACACEVEAAGIVALLPAEDGGLFVAGYRQDRSMRSAAWIARLEPTCAPACPIAWEQSIPGAEADTYFGRAELVRDAVFALMPAPGGVIAAGTVDREPWAARYADDGAEQWVMERGTSSGAALAIAASTDAACLTLVGSEKYGNYAERRWWARRVAMQ